MEKYDIEIICGSGINGAARIRIEAEDWKVVNEIKEIVEGAITPENKMIDFVDHCNGTIAVFHFNCDIGNIAQALRRAGYRNNLTGKED